MGVCRPVSWLYIHWVVSWCTLYIVFVSWLYIHCFTGCGPAPLSEAPRPKRWPLNQTRCSKLHSHSWSYSTVKHWTVKHTRWQLHRRRSKLNSLVLAMRRQLASNLNIASHLCCCTALRNNKYMEKAQYKVALKSKMLLWTLWIWWQQCIVSLQWRPSDSDCTVIATDKVCVTECPAKGLSGGLWSPPTPPCPPLSLFLWLRRDELCQPVIFDAGPCWCKDSGALVHCAMQVSKWSKKWASEQVFKWASVQVCSASEQVSSPTGVVSSSQIWSKACSVLDPAWGVARISFKFISSPNDSKIWLPFHHITAFPIVCVCSSEGFIMIIATIKVMSLLLASL